MNKSHFKYIIYILITGFLLINCGGSDSDNELDLPTITISVSPTTINIPSAGGEQTFTITTNAEKWTVSTTADWFTITEDGRTVKVEAEANLADKRSATIECKVDGKTAKASLTVSQDQETKVESDRLALTDLGKSLNIDWDFNSDISKWEGVTLKDKQVVALELAGKNLKGSLPASIGRLTGLKYIDLQGNALEGKLPAEINELTNLEYLDVSNNKLVGDAPSLKSLTKLIVLDCSSNGLISMPELAASLASLEYLALNDNKILGNLPANLADYVNLIYLDLSQNNFSGNMPTGWSSLSKIRALHLYNNTLSGTIPSYILQYDNLKSLALNHNNLEGKIPTDLGSLSKLEELYLMQNRLTGTVPNSLLANTYWSTWQEYVYLQQEGYGFTNAPRTNFVRHIESKNIQSLGERYKERYRR